MYVWYKLLFSSVTSYFKDFLGFLACLLPLIGTKILWVVDLLMAVVGGCWSDLLTFLIHYLRGIKG